jgi:hypothetical protein
MRLLPNSKTTTDKPAKPVPASTAGVPAAGATKGDGDGAEAKAQVAAAQPVAAAPVVTAPDYTRPQNSTELLFDLQRRVIALEELSYRKLTANEWAITIEASTGLSLDQWSKQGYVAESCPCTKLRCKGWKLTPVEHKRMAGSKTPLAEGGAEVKPEELKDVVAAPVPEKEKTASFTKEEWHQKVFSRMLKDGLITQKKDTTHIPKDGPITWKVEEMLAFAYTFELTDLLELEGKPRELQRRLIAALREIGYNVLSAPEKG